MVTTTSDDVLLLIFDDVAGPAHISWPKASYDDVRACAPYRLASVCRRWRDLALATSSLWTYFGFPPAPIDHDRHLTRLQDLVSRSSRASIDVLFAYEIEASDESGPPGSIQILDTLVGLVSRWRSARVCIPAMSMVQHLQNDLAQEAPILEQLFLIHHSSILQIPRAPLLTRLCLDTYERGDLQCSTLLPSLRSLIMYSADGALTELMCKTYSQQLVELSISDDLWDKDFGPVDFPCLVSLNLDDASYLQRLRAPNLHTLALNAGQLESQPPSSLSQFPDLGHLILYGNLADKDLEALKHFGSISRLSFVVPDEINATIKTEQSSEFFGGFLGRFPSSTCPRLVRVTFSPDADGLSFDELEDFVVSRTLDFDRAVQEAPGAQASLCRLESVEFNRDSAPDDFCDRLREYLLPFESPGLAGTARPV
ncbi:hypothetical protein BKA62DRAFT_698933 [Auriculariales sp. MPI-PUGE-AT-0066]|nr:hypothetical protein BKA62DRAFT_698933 [Auriculariales sp. MPI-PUGE-AT-0066]